MQLKHSVVDFVKFYLVDVLYGIVLLIVGLTVSNEPLYDRFFLERDPSLSYPLVGQEEISVALLGVLAFVIPVILILATQVLFFLVKKTTTLIAEKQESTYRECVLIPYLALAQGIASTLVITQILKGFCGRKRPNFFAMCDYKGYRTAVATRNFTYYDANTVAGAIGSIKDCLETNQAMLFESQYSFPSGHASTIFAGLTVLCLYWIHVSPKHGFKGTSAMRFRAIQFFFMMILMIACSLVSGTRTRDYWHNFDDILGGAAIGFGCACFTFWINLHRVGSSKEEDGTGNVTYKGAASDGV